MKDDGSKASGDKVANDGVYSLKVSDTSMPGLYRFKVTLNWDDEKLGKVRRTEFIDRIVTALPDNKRTLVKVVRVGETGDYQITITPKDKHENYIGPGYKSFFDIKVEGMEKVPQIDNPNVDGNYLVKLTGIRADSDPRVKISFKGKTLRNAPLSKLADGGCTWRSFCCKFSRD